MADKSELKEIGCLWAKKSAKGVKFLAGELTIKDKNHSILIFVNDKGDNDKRPDYRIYATGEVKPATFKPSDRKKAPEPPEPNPPADEDTPF